MNFETVANQYLHELEQRSAVRSSTLNSYRSLIRTHLAPRYNHLEMAAIVPVNNRLLKELVTDLRSRYKPASIVAVVNLFKMIVDSPCDENGARLYRCDWNHNFIGVPPVIASEQKAPIITAAEINSLVSTHRDRLLFGILAGTGARIAEILALTTDDWDQNAGILFIRQSKTASGIREIDLPWQLNDWLRAGLGDMKPHSKLFPYTAAAYRKRAFGVTGFAHSFRRFRLTHLRKTGMPEDLLRYALGHSDRTISDRYSRLKLDRAYRREQVERCRLGFTVPTQPAPESEPRGVEHATMIVEAAS